MGDRSDHTNALLALTARVVTAACLLVLVLSAGVSRAEELEIEPVCAAAEVGQVECLSLEVEPEEEKAEAAFEGSGERGGFSPADLKSAYKLNTEAGEGKTIAITIAYDNPNAEADLAVYRSTYGLPPCTTANGCFKKVNQLGEEKNYPAPNANWAYETSLDLDMASAVCPKCNILLVEADDNLMESLGIAVNKAAELGATVISNSWGGGEFEGQAEYEKYFHHPGIPITASSGDGGLGVIRPATFPEVIAIGGTSLRKDPGTRGWAEDAWKGAGSGCSHYAAKPAWQKDTGCKNRFIADVSAVADPQTPVSVYDTYKTVQPWQLVGGTSASAPIIAGVEALSSKTMRDQGPEAFYNGTAGPLFDPAEGLNGYCAGEKRYYCHAELGFDGPTGNGTPNMTPTASPLVASASTEIGVTEAKLIGTVNPRGFETKYRFEYGPTTSYGSSVPVGEGNAGSGSTNVQVSSAVKGLEGEKTYHFRLVATNSKGTTYGEDRHLFTRGPNWAAEPTHLANYGSSGSGAGQFAKAYNVAVSPVSGNIFVTDGVPNNRVQVFDVEGKFIRQFGSTGKEPGKFEEPYGITVDTHGHVWVVDNVNIRVQELTEEGAVIQSFGLAGVSTGPAGIAVDANDNAWVTIPGEERAVEYDKSGKYLREFSTGEFPLGITIDQAGNIWNSNNEDIGGRLEEHDATGEFIKSIAPNTVGGFRWGAAGQLAVDPNSNIWVTSFNTSAYIGYGPREFFAEANVFSSTGNYEQSFGFLGTAADQMEHPRGLALDPRGYIWIADDRLDRLSKWSIPPLGNLAAATESASAVSSGGATLNGGVNPGGFNATYKFEYGKTTSYGKVVPSSGGAVGAGYSTAKVNQVLTGLEPNTTYHYRVRATNVSGTITGEDKTFTTPRAISAPTYSSSFGSKGTGNGQFTNPWGIAVDPSGNVWVADSGNNRVQKFNSKGEYQCQIGTKGTGNGQFGFPRGIAADSSGNVWVADSNNSRVQKISSSCGYLSQFGKAGSGDGSLSFPLGITVDPTGNVWVADSGNQRVQKFNSKGEYVAKCGSLGSGDGQFEEEPISIAADADGDVWVGDEAGRMEKFNSKCEYLDKFNQASSGAPNPVLPFSFAIDPSGNLWISGITTYSVSGFFPEGEYMAKFGASGTGAGQFTSPLGIAAAADGTLWVIDNSSAVRIQKWSPGAAYPVETGRAASVKRTEATLTGKVNPEGVATSYQFEYGTTAAFGKVAPASAKSVGSGSSPVAVSEALSGLKAGTTYYYHLVATSAKGTTYGEIRHFKTLAPAGVGAQVRIGGKTFAELGITEAAISLSGSFMIEIPSYGNLKLSCSESGTGTLVSSGVSKETVTLNCSIVGQSPESKCKVNQIKFTVNGKFESGFSLSFNEYCGLQEEIPLSSMSGSFEFGTEAITVNVNSNATAKFGGNAVYLTGNSKWSLSGTYVGKTLGFW